MDPVEIMTQAMAIGKRRHARPGDALQLYTGMRTKACRKLRDAKCTLAIAITISSDGVKIGSRNSPLLSKSIAKKDGFKDFAEMAAWFDKTHGLPFSGVLISWDPDFKHAADATPSVS